MLVNTKYFGQIDLGAERIIRFPNGLLGLEEYKDYTILFEEQEETPVVYWLQSIDEPGIALPVIYPTLVKEDYQIEISEENQQILGDIGEIVEEDLIAFVTLTGSSDPKKITVNLKAPILIHASEKKGCQLILDNREYKVKYPIYKSMKQKEIGGRLLC